MDWTTIITAVITFIAGGGIFTLVTVGVQKKKMKAEIKADEIENMKKAMENFYDPLIQRQNTRISELETEVKTLREEKHAMELSYQKQIDELRKELNDLQTEMLSRIADALSRVPARGTDGKFVKKEAK